jgi:hypothetical protein
MLSIGGINPSAASFQDAINSADNLNQDLKVFDLTTMQWTKNWDPSLPVYAMRSSTQRWDVFDFVAALKAFARKGYNKYYALYQHFKEHKVPRKRIFKLLVEI